MSIDFLEVDSCRALLSWQREQKLCLILGGTNCHGIYTCLYKTWYWRYLVKFLQNEASSCCDGNVGESV